MHKKNLYNYFSKVLCLLAPLFCINLTNKMLYCSLLCTFSTLILNWIASLHGGKKAILAMLACTLITSALLYHHPYCIVPGKPISGLIATSLCALSIAGYIGVNLFLRLEKQYGFALSNSISLSIGATVDHLIMALFFMRTLPIPKIVTLFSKEMGYTFLFSFLLYLFSVVVLYAKPLYRAIAHHTALLIFRRGLKSKRLF